MAVSTILREPSPAVHHPRQLSESVRVGDVADSMSRWQSASERAKNGGLLLRIEFASDPKGPEPYRVASSTSDGIWYNVSPRLVCDCQAGQHGHVCRHAARVALWWWHLGTLRRCARCGGWDHCSAGQHTHVGGISPDQWMHGVCPTSAVSA